MSNLDKVRAKIAALLQKTEANGATESEAATAMAIAEKMMFDYGVTLDDIKSNNAAANDFVKRQFNDGVKLSVVDNYIATSIAKYTDTKVWNQKTQTGYKSSGARKTSSNVMFYGYSVDVELAYYIYKTCEHALEHEWKLFSVKVPQGHRKQARGSFLLGMAVRLRDRLNEMKQQTVVSTGNALVVAKFEMVERSFREDLGMGKLTKNYSSGRKYYNGNAFEAGKKAGDNVRFNRAVNDGPTGGVKMIA